MLYNAPPIPGYNSNSPNRQTLGSLATPGVQSQPQSLGVNYQINPFAQVSQGGKPGTSSFTQPSSQPANMNQYLNSPNISTLLRALVGNTTTSRAKL